jgi:cytochrome b561
MKPSDRSGGAPAADVRWSSVQQLLHWIVAALVLFQLVVGLFFLEFKDDQPPPLLPLHASVGVTIGILTLALLASRLMKGRPPLPDDISPGLNRLARATHAVLYALLLAQFVVGYLLEDTFGTRVHLFGLPLPVFIGETKGLPNLFGTIHRWIGYGLVAVVGLHLAGALAHEFRFRDNVLRRMTPLPFRDTGR